MSSFCRCLLGFVTTAGNKTQRANMWTKIGGDLVTENIRDRLKIEEDRVKKDDQKITGEDQKITKGGGNQVNHQYCTNPMTEICGGHQKVR